MVKMNKQLIVIDAQEDFTRGVLGNEYAASRLPIIQEIADYAFLNFDRPTIYTKDTHECSDYELSLEKYYGIAHHCIKLTKGWQLCHEAITERSEENEIIVSELQDTVEYFCGLYEEDKELKGNALKDLKNAVERLEVFNAIGSIYQWGVEVLNKCGIKYRGLKESKKVMNEKVDSRYKYVFNHTKDEYEIVQFDDHNFEILAIPNDKSIFSNDLPKFKIEKTYIYDTCINNNDITLFVGIVEELGWCFIAFDKLANNNNIFAYYISGKTKEGAYHSFHEYKSEYNLRCEESKKSSRKSLNESKNIKKSLEIIRRKIIELVNDETIQDEFNEIFDLGGSSFDTVDDWFETTVHNVLHDVLKDWTIERIPF
jgi:hypothetical protein